VIHVRSFYLRLACPRNKHLGLMASQRSSETGTNVEALTSPDLASPALLTSPAEPSPPSAMSMPAVDARDPVQLSSKHVMKRGIGGRWTPAEDEKLKVIIKEYGAKNWKVISKLAFNGSRTDVQCLHRWQKVLKPGLVKGPWTPSEDEVIMHLIEAHGIGNIKWSEIAASLPGRLGKQCRERWVNHLDPRLKKTPWTEEEDRILMEKQTDLGNKWRDIAEFLPGRSENSVKNRWNSAKRKRRRSEFGQSNEETSEAPTKRPPRPKKTSRSKEKKIVQKASQKPPSSSSSSLDAMSVVPSSGLGSQPGGPPPPPVGGHFLPSFVPMTAGSSQLPRFNEFDAVFTSNHQVFVPPIPMSRPVIPTAPLQSADSPFFDSHAKILGLDSNGGTTGAESLFFKSKSGSED